jgi:hypothetical protein
MALELMLEKSIFKGLKMKEIDYEQFIEDFNCVYGADVKQAVYEFFENESEIRLFLNLVSLNKGKIQHEFYVLLDKELKRKGYVLPNKKRWSYPAFERFKYLLFLSLFIDLREKYNDFFVEKNYRFLQDLLI